MKYYQIWDLGGRASAIMWQWPESHRQFTYHSVIGIQVIALSVECETWPADFGHSSIQQEQPQNLSWEVGSHSHTYHIIWKRRYDHDHDYNFYFVLVMNRITFLDPFSSSLSKESAEGAGSQLIISTSLVIKNCGQIVFRLTVPQLQET